MPEETSNDRAQRFDRQIESTKAKNVRDRSVAIAWLAEALRELEREDPSQRFDALSALASAIDDPWAQADAVHGLVNGLAALERKDRTQRYDTCVELARSIKARRSVFLAQIVTEMIAVYKIVSNWENLMENHRVKNSKFQQRGLTLVELLVVLTIIATLAAIIYPAIIDSMKKSQAAMVADRLDAIQKAKVQYQLDAEAAVSPAPTPFPDSHSVDFGTLQKYLLRFGQQLQSPGDLDQGTGGTFNLGTWGGSPWFQPTDGTNNPYLAKYNIPTTAPSATPGQ